MKAWMVGVGAAVAAIAGFVAGHVSSTGDEEAAPAPETDVVGPPDGQYRVVIGRSPQRGPENALVTVVEFVDYQDEDVVAAQPAVEQLLRKYGTKVRVVFKQNPDAAHTKAIGAAEAAMAASAQDKFWPMHRRLVASHGKLARADLEAHAKAAGLDLAAFRSALDQHEFARLVESDMRMASRFGVKGAPMFFVNGWPLAGAPTLASLSRLVDRELPKAQRVLDTGIPADRLYAQLLRDAKRSVDDAGLGPGDTTRGAVRPSEVERPDAVYKIAIEGAPVRGPADALVTMVEYTDFQCPYCARVRETIDAIFSAYPGKVRLVHMMNPLPMHDQAFPAAEAAMAAHAQGKYWEMENLLFSHQRELSAEKYGELATELGLDVARFRRETESHAYRDRIHEGQEVAMRLGARGTPMFFLNGRKMPGAAPIDRFRARIEEEIARAQQAMRESHVPASGLYAFLTKDGADRMQLVSNERPEVPAIPGRPGIRSIPRPGLGPVDEVPPPRSGGGGTQESRGTRP